MRSRGAGGCDFPVAPNIPADQGTRFWIPALRPDALLLAPASLEHDAQAARSFALPMLPGIDIRQVNGICHALWRFAGVDHHVWLRAPFLQSASAYVVILPLDALFELRAHAARRFWRALNGKSPGHPLRPLPDQTRDRHILTLRALDAYLAGESYRTIAEVLLGFRGRTKNDWEVSPLKNRARRLVADGLRYMRGGYRELLRYPIKLRRRR